MKKFTLFILAILFIILNLSAQNRHIIVGKNYQNPNEITLVAERGTSTTIKFDLNELNLTEMETNLGKANLMNSAKAPVIIEKGVPELIYLPTAIIIPDVGSAELNIVYGEFTEIENVEIAPSKGSIPRTIDPATIPYEKGEVYNQNAFFPGTLAQINETFIMRDVRGATLFTYPVQYNPVTKILRIYSEITITVNYTETKGENEFTTQKRHETIDPTFAQMYENLFLNYNNLTRGFPTGEEGELLIICAPSFMADMQPFVDWKRTIGRKTTLVSTAVAGTTSTAIKTYITNYYNANNLSHVLLVGGSALIPPVGTSNPRSDIKYGQINSGNYLDVLVGRFSATTSAHVQTQVQKAIYYEQNLNTTDTWLNNGIGLAANEGNGGGHDGGEADYVHMNNIRTKMLTYGYTTVYQEYTWNCPGITNTTVSQISSRFNSGVSIGNYCNHGSPTAWTMSTSSSATMDYTNSHVNALTNVNKLPFICSVACNTGEFGNWQYNSGGAVCFAETWLRANNGGSTGAIGFLGSTISMSWLPPMTGQDVFANITMDLNSYTGTQPGIKRTMAGAFLNASQKMYMIHSSSALNDYNSWVVFGDPTLMFRTKTPQAMTVTHNPTIPPTETSLSVTCVEGALAALTYTDMSGTSPQVVILGTAVAGSNNIAVINYTMPSPAPENVKLAVTGFNKVTYTATIPVSSQPQYCEPPVNLTLEPFVCGITLTWYQPINIDGTLLSYNIYINGVLNAVPVPSTVTTFTFENIDEGTYTFHVVANYEHCVSVLSEVATIELTCGPTLCEPPIQVEVEPFNCGAKITWLEPENIDGTLLRYHIFMDSTLLTSSDYPNTSLIYTITLDSGIYNYHATHTFQVSAVYEHCESVLTDGVSVEIICGPQWCEPPIDLTVISEEADAVLSWEPPVNIDGTLLGYNIYRDNVQINDELVENPEYRDVDLEDGTYIYQISAVYLHCNESVKTDSVSVTIYFEGISHITNTFKIYPNPTTGELIIDNGQLTIINVDLFDVLGKKQLSIINCQLLIVKMDISNLSNGIYFIKIETEEGTVTKKVIKH